MVRLFTNGRQLMAALPDRLPAALLAGLLTGLVVACGGQSAATPTTDTDITPPATATSAPDIEPTTDAYPPPEPTPVGYPAPTQDPYPVGGQVWINSPSGFQCEETLRYESMSDARIDLQEAGIPIAALETTDLLVCEACGCPNSLHYRALIDSVDVAAAAELGWQQEP